MNRFFTFFALILTLFALPVSAATITLTWTAPTQCSDGSPVSDCAVTGYEIHMGASATGTAYTKRAESPAANATSQTLTNISPGTRCFFMKALAGTLVSAESNRVCVTVPAIAPKAPVLTITIAVANPPP